MTKFIEVMSTKGEKHLTNVALIADVTYIEGHEGCTIVLLAQDKQGPVVIDIKETYTSFMKRIKSF